MILKNISQGTIVATDLKEATSFLDLALGLLRKSNPRTMLFKTHFGIHTFFLKEPIDVIVLDEQFKIVKITENLKINKLFFWNPKYFLVIELPKNTIRLSKTKTKDRLSVE